MCADSSAPYKSDLLNRADFARRFERFLLTEHHFVDGALVMTLNAPFGAGKTTFVRMWTDELRMRRKEDPKLPRPIVLNAWEADYCGDPLVAILAALKDALVDPAAPDPEPGIANKLVEAIKDGGWFALGIAGSMVSKATGVDALKAGDLAAEKKTERAEAAEFYPKDVLDAYQRRRDALAKLKAALTDAFGGEEARALVIVDELDRCRPDYAVHYLEVIKHVFDIHGIAFVLCVDEQQLASAASVLFGSRLSFDDYYRKFSHRTVRLPRPAAYAKLSDLNARPHDVADVVLEVFKSARHRNWWFELMVGGIRHDDQWEKETIKEFKRLGLAKPDEEVDVRRALRDFLLRDHYPETSLMKQIHDKIESIAAFSER